MNEVNDEFGHSSVIAIEIGQSAGCNIMITKYRKPSGSYMYLIPGELIKKSKITSKTKVRKGVDSYVAQRQIVEVLKECCELTLQEFYDKVELGINDPKDRPKCQQCGKPLSFSGRLSHGYGNHIDRGNLFCSPRCTTLFTSSHPEIYIPRGFKDPKVLIKTQRSDFINRGKFDDICKFYLAKLADGRIKLGITKSISGRIRRSNRTQESKYIKVIVLRKMLRSDIAQLEYVIKKQFNYTEYVTSLSDMIKIARFVRDY